MFHPKQWLWRLFIRGAFWKFENQERLLFVTRTVNFCPNIWILSRNPVPFYNGETLFWQNAVRATTRVSSKQTNKISVRTEKNLNRFCFGLFHETKNKNCRFVSKPISKQPKQTELFRNKPQQPSIFIKISKYALYQTVSVVLCLFRFNRNIKTLCFDIEVKQPKHTISKQTKTNHNKPEKTLNFLKK